MKITLKSGDVREYANAMPAIEIAKSISEGLARNVCAAKVNGEVVDMRTEISEEKTDANSAVLARIEKGMKVKLFCYHAFHDVKMEGRVSKIDIVYKYLVLNETKIYFDDIYDIRICDYR